VEDERLRIGELMTWQHIPDGPEDGEQPRRGFEVNFEFDGEGVTLYVSVEAEIPSKIALEQRDAMADALRESLRSAEVIAEANSRLITQLQ
jgi:hypothetical protein